MTDLVHLGTDLIPFEGDGVEGGAGALPTPGPMPQAHRCCGVALRCILERLKVFFVGTLLQLYFLCLCFEFWKEVVGGQNLLSLSIVLQFMST